MGVQPLDWEDPQEEEMATGTTVLAWRIQWTEEPGRLHSMGLKELDMTEWVCTHTHTHTHTHRVTLQYQSKTFLNTLLIKLNWEVF